MFSLQTRRLWLLSLSFPALPLLCAACAPDAPTGPRESGVIHASVVGARLIAGLAGFAVLNDAGEKVALGASKSSDGTVVGFASGVNPGSLNGPVVELVPPHGASDFWCANVAVANVPELPGFNFLWLIKDLGDGKTSLDQLATNGGFGLTCAAGAGTPFAAVMSGDFRSTVR